MVLDRFLQKEVLQLLELHRILRGQIVGEAEVVPGVVEFPFVIEERCAWLHLPRCPVHGAGQPAVGVDGPVAHDLEVLDIVSARRLGIGKCVHHAHPFDRLLWRAIHDFRLRQLRRFQNRRRNVDDMMELRAHLAFCLDALGPMNHHPVAGAAETGGDLLGPRKRRIARDGPPGSHVGIRQRAAEVVVVRQNVLDGFMHAVEVGHLVKQAIHAAFGARAIVADDVEDQRIVHLARLLDGLDQPADLRVRVLAEAGVDLHLTTKQFLLVIRELVPILNGFRFGRELRALRDDAQLDLPSQSLFAELVPPSIELALVLGDPFLRDMMGRMRGAGGEVRKNGLSGVSDFW